MRTAHQQHLLDTLEELAEMVPAHFRNLFRFQGTRWIESNPEDAGNLVRRLRERFGPAACEGCR